MSRKTSFCLLVLLCVGLLQWAFFFQSEIFTWDAAFYYTMARSLVFDHDLRIANDLALSYPTATPDFEAKEYHSRFVYEDRVYNPFAIGTSLAWTPWFQLMKLGYDLRGQSVNGFEWSFRVGAATISLLLGWSAFAVGFYIAAWDSSRYWAFWATLTALLATPLLYYLYREPGYSHAISAFATAVVVLLWLRRNHSLSLASGFSLGLLVGIAALVRWQHVVYLLLPTYSALRALSGKEISFRNFGGYGLMLGLGFLIGLSPQLVAWRLSTGRWLTVPQGESFMVWLPLYLPQFLFSTYRGVLSWMPLFFPAMGGLITLARRHRDRYIPLILVLLVEVYVNASTRDWMGCGGYGPRRLSSELVILIIGYGAFLAWISKRQSFLPHALNVVLVVHQLVLFRFGLVDELGGIATAKIADTYQIVEATPWRGFVVSVFGRLPLLLRVESYVLPGSFISNATRGIRSWASLVVLAVFIIVAASLIRLIRSLYQPHTHRFIILTATVMSALVIALNVGLLIYG